MTTTADAGVAVRPRSTSRVIPSARLLVANPWTTLVMPALLLLLILAVNIAIWALIVSGTSGADRADAIKGFSYSGASFFAFVYMMIVAAQAMNATFAWAMALGTSRRDFYLGSALAFVVLSALYATAFTVLAVVEETTHGWGLGGRMFTPVYFGVDPTWGERLWVFFVGFLFFFFVGSTFGAVFVRWGANGLVAALAALAVAGVGLAALVTFAGDWAAFGRSVLEAGTLGVANALLVPALLGAAIGYLVLRRARARG